MSATADQRIKALVDLHRWRDVLPLVTSELATRPDDPDLHGWRAQAAVGTADWPTALESANRLVMLAPDRDWGHRLASIALDRMGRAHEAVRAAREAVRLAPHLWHGHMQLAQAAVDVRGGMPEALRAANEAVRLGPNEADTHFTLGLVHQRCRQTAAARTAYERALALDPDHAMARNNLTVLAGRWHLGAKIRGYAAGLRSAPDSKVLQENLDGLIRTFPIRLYVGALAALVVGMIAALATHPAGPATITVAAVFVAGTVGYTALTLRRLPGNVRGYFIRRLFRSPAALWSWLIFAVAAVLALATCLVPGGSGLSLGMFQPVFITLVVVRIVRAVSGRRRG